MTAFLRGNLMGTGDCQVSSGPEPDVIGKGSSCTGHKIRDALDTGKLHLIAGLVLILILGFLFRCITGKKPLDHELQETVFG